MKSEDMNAAPGTSLQAPRALHLVPASLPVVSRVTHALVDSGRGSRALAPVAVGALAAGAVAVGALAIGRVRIGNAAVEKPPVQRLIVQRLEIETWIGERRA
jgi:hypothetical protein